ncbi:hypothetical protein HXX76_010395 [Chlamydomonas incerta]|uniref:Uncharacterized protein n=1 Tax=Chlamydomonas incerta TaxID=51695 RepID=A0A835SHN3_CHLIN|nr:hypothetical protein HXX76_010395 [Chlamydomonas incerta]|eukprot:KAG2422614.1 hypothetical protein HXX76_010395 [Chlamydomonas incerta]
MAPEIPVLFKAIATQLAAEGLKPAAAACNRLVDSFEKQGANDAAHSKLVSALDAVPVDRMARVVAGLQPAALRVLLGLSDNMEDAFLRARLVPELALRMLQAAALGDAAGPAQLLGALYGPALDYCSDDEDAAAAEGLVSLLLRGDKATAAAGKEAKGKEPKPQGSAEAGGGEGQGEPWFCGAARLGHLGVLKAAVASSGAAGPSKEQLAAALRAAVLCGRQEAYRLLLDECGAPADAIDVARDLMAVATGSTGCSSGSAGAGAAAALRWQRVQQDRANEAVRVLVGVARERGQMAQMGPELLLRALAAAARALQPEAVRALAAMAHGAVAAGGGDGEEAVAGAATALLWELVCGGPGAGEPLGMRGGVDDNAAATAASGGAAEDGDDEAPGPGEEAGEDQALAPQFATYKALVAAGGARVRLSLAQLRELQARPGASAALAALRGEELVRVAAAGAAAGAAADDTQLLEAVAGKGAKPWAADVAAVAALAALRAGGKEAPSASAAAAAVAAAATELSWAEVPLLLQGPAAGHQAGAGAGAGPAAKKRKTGASAAPAEAAAPAAAAAGQAAEPADGVHVLLAAAHVGNAAGCLFFITGDGEDDDEDPEEEDEEEEDEDEEGGQAKAEKRRRPALPEEARPRPLELVMAVQVAARRGGGGAGGCWRLVDMLLGRLLCQVMMDQLMLVTRGGGGGAGGDGSGSGSGSGSDGDSDGEQEAGGDGEGKKRRRGAGAPGDGGSKASRSGSGSAAELIESNPNLKLMCHVVSGDGASAGDIMAGRAGDDGDDEDEGEEGEGGEKAKEAKEAKEAGGVPASSYWVARALQLAASRGDVGRVVELVAGIEVRCRQEREQREQEAAGKGPEAAGGAALTWGQAVMGCGVLAAMRTAVGALAGARRLRAPAERRARLLGGQRVVQVLAHASGRQPAAAVAQDGGSSGVAEVRAAVAAAHAELHYACKAARERGSSGAATAAAAATGGDGAEGSCRALGFRWASIAPAVREAIAEGRPEVVGGDKEEEGAAGGLWESWESSEEAEEYEAEQESEESEEGEEGEGEGEEVSDSDGEDGNKWGDC